MASTGVAAVEQLRSSARQRALEFAGREGLLVAALGLYAVAMAVRLPDFISQDTWYALVGGREVLHHGLPNVDSLTYFTAGKHWIDQQWLGQALMYALFSVGGIKLVAFVNAAIVVGTLAFGLYGARRLGAGPRAVAIVFVGSVALLLGNASEVRTQTLVFPLFVGLLLLLLEDVRRPSRRIFWVFPILILWANLHGSVVIGATLVAVRGALLLLSRSSDRRLRGVGLLLVLGGPLAATITPYGVSILHYYRETLLDPSFKQHIVEWQAPALSPITAPLYVIAGTMIWLLGRRHQEFRAFERLVLLLLITLAFWSIRNVVWLGFGGLLILAPAVEAIFRGRRSATTSTNVRLGLGVGPLILVALGLIVGHPASWLLRSFPARAASVVATTAAVDPRLKIYSNERFADWLLLMHPELRGRIAYDSRFELVTKAQMESIVRFRVQLTDSWRAATDGARLLVLDPENESKVEKVLLSRSALRRIYRDRLVSVLLRPQTQLNP